jgi:hypothetical protein
MESTLTSFMRVPEICVEKAAQVFRWLSETEDPTRSEFAAHRLFETGVLKENTKGFLHSLLEFQFPGERIDLELPADQLRDFLTDAFHNTYQYLAAPQAFLAHFLTMGSGTMKLSSDVVSRLSYLVDYPYFPEMIDDWIVIKLEEGKKEITKNQLLEFLFQSDRTVLRYSELPELQKYLEPIFEFYGTSLLPREIVRTVFLDKKLKIPVKLDKDEYTAEEMASALKEAVISLPADAEEFAPIAEYDSFLKELREIGVILPPPNLQDGSGHPALPPVQMFISKKLRKKCLEKIFHENRFEYERMIDLINATNDYSQAELNLHTLLGIHKVKSDSKTAHRLQEVLRMRFGKQSELLEA